MAAVASELLFVEAPTVESALELIDQLRGVHAELAPGEGDSCRVAIELDGDDNCWFSRVSEGLQKWLARGSAETVRLELDGRSYVLESSTN